MKNLKIRKKKEAMATGTGMGTAIVNLKIRQKRVNTVTAMQNLRKIKGMGTAMVNLKIRQKEATGMDTATVMKNRKIRKSKRAIAMVIQKLLKKRLATVIVTAMHQDKTLLSFLQKIPCLKKFHWL